DGMTVRTNTPDVRAARRFSVELILSDHHQECPTCARNLNCELQRLADRVGVREIHYSGSKREAVKDESTPSLVRDNGKCILCGRCASVCQQTQGVAAIGYSERGYKTTVGPSFGRNLADVSCVLCGQCIHACPVAAIRERDDTVSVWEALADTGKHVVVQTAPAVRAAIGEEFGLPAGTPVTGRMVTALRRLGFDAVFDTDFTADLTILEEGNELLHRLQHGGVLPMITSCSPGWIKFCEHFFPEELDHLSSCKSPQQMFGAVAKTYYAEKLGLRPEEIFVVSIMPCTAKKFEAGREEMASNGIRDVDVVLTTREAAAMIKEAGIDLSCLPNEDFDAPLGMSTGAGAIFGNTGGVMEAALRTVYEVVTGETLAELDFQAVRGMEGVKEATVPVGDIQVKVAVAHGLSNARTVMERVAAGEADYHFIEIMCCPGGCIGGGGQPIPTDDAIRAKRIQALYDEDLSMKLRKSHENPAVTTLYEEFLGKPYGSKAHKLLHTSYTPRGVY
ncbi:MAG: NADH-dependent [FeFe] hydrogenase, group A6, partial [bacterium]|nr:NADH-dependent [FeFe] hydrogenase, group A6 [bacterium]